MCRGNIAYFEIFVILITLYPFAHSELCTPISVQLSCWIEQMFHAKISLNISTQLTTSIMKAHKLSPVKIPIGKLASAKVPHAPGVYILYRTNMGAPAYVGRDDYRLYDAIDTHRLQGKYNYFKFMRCNNPVDAYQWECMFWHKGQATIDNSEAHGGAHPKPPRGESIACPYPGCDFEPDLPTVNWDTEE